MNGISIFLRGILMGMCDIVPGISGGTIAFITGIYERFINSVENLIKFIVNILMLREKPSIEKAKTIELPFLLLLALGIIIAIILGSRGMKFLLENYFIYTISFFIGLILASSKIIFEHINDHGSKNLFFGFLGFLFGISLAFLVPLNIIPSPFYLFLAGFLAISAMFLPGVSGAFVLLIMGIYEYVVGLLHSFWNNLPELAIFASGAILGAAVISRMVSVLFEKDRCKTLYVLLGLVLGSLALPVRGILERLGENDLLTALLFVGIGAVPIMLKKV
jgi:putative membrane protein